MAGVETAALGRALLLDRGQRAAEYVAAVPEVCEALLERPVELPRTLVTTGIGTSEGHARHLADVATRWLGQPARFAATSSLAHGAPPGSGADWLVVFSQGLSANARYALQDVESWGGVVLVTGLFGAIANAASGEPIAAEKRDWMADLTSRGVVCVDMGCGVEYGALIRVIGSRVGYAVAWSLLRTLALRRLQPADALRPDAERLAAAQLEAAQEARRVFDPLQTGRTSGNRVSPSTSPPDPSLESRGSSVERFFAPDRTLLLVGEGGTTELAEQLSLKIAEGMLRPQPRWVDVLQFAHGPLQSLAGKPASILYVLPHESDALRAAEARLWVERLASTLDPDCHELRVVQARLPMPFAVVEFEAIFDHWILAVLGATGGDVVEWAGGEREAALYEVGPARSGQGSNDDVAVIARAAVTRLEDAVWPEVEASIEAGRRTALIALGSVEQHGPHLPLGTDRWIADALSEGLSARLDDAIALPSIAVGCASEHLDFAGTLHVEPETLEAILRDQLASLRRHGFERAFLFTAHGGNLDALEAMRARLVASSAPLDLRIETDLRVGVMQSEAVEAAALPGRSAGPHAGEYETSIVAWLRPGSIRRDALVAGRIVERGEGQGLFYPSLRPNAASGVLGDPSAASADRGERYLGAWIDLLETAYRAAFSKPNAKTKPRSKSQPRSKSSSN